MRLGMAQMELQAMQELRDYYRILSDSARLRILEQLARRELTVTELARGLKMSQPLVSWHLRRLTRAGLVRIRRDGREVHCSIGRTRMHDFERQFEMLITQG